MAFCQVYVAEQALPGVAGSVGATEQAESLEVTCYVLGRNMRWYAFMPVGAQGWGEGFHAATELYREGMKLAGKGGKPVAVHVVDFEPRVWMPFPIATCLIMARVSGSSSMAEPELMMSSTPYSPVTCSSTFLLTLNGVAEVSP